MVNNDDFKYVLQDIGHIYFGKELTYQDMMDRDDVVFKWKAIIGSYISKDVTDLNTKMIDHILDIDETSFSYKIFSQIKMDIKFFYKEEVSKGTKQKTRWVHASASLKDFTEKRADSAKRGDITVEEIGISKLALMTISI